MLYQTVTFTVLLDLLMLMCNCSIWFRKQPVGVYSGTGVTDRVKIALILSWYYNLITYTFRNTAGCSASDDLEVFV
jgi:hypothetical protein